MKISKVLKPVLLVASFGGVAVVSAAVGALAGGIFTYVKIDELQKQVTEKNIARGSKYSKYDGPRPKSSDTKLKGVSGHVSWSGFTPDGQQIDAVETSTELIIRHLGLVNENDKTTEDTKFGLVRYNVTSYGWSVVLERLYDSPVSFAGPRYRITHHHNESYMTLTEIGKTGDGPSMQYPIDDEFEKRRTELEVIEKLTNPAVREKLLESFEEDMPQSSMSDRMLRRYKSGYSIATIAEYYGVTQEKVVSLLKGTLSDQITDLTIAADKKELAQAVELSMKVMDEEKVRTLLDSVEGDEGSDG